MLSKWETRRCCVDVKKLRDADITCDGKYNFRKLPQKFESVTTYLEEATAEPEQSDSSDSDGRNCINNIDPITQFTIPLKLTEIPGDDPDKCYQSENDKYPIGILFPFPALHEFEPVAAIAIPTEHLNIPIVAGAGRGDVVSGCSQFKIERSGSSSIRVTKGYVNIGQQCVPCGPCDPCGSINLSSESRIQFYVQAIYNFSRKEWDASIQYSQGIPRCMPAGAGARWKSLGTVYSDGHGLVDIIQSICGPVDLNDPVTEHSPPPSDDTLYVFSWRGNSMSWIPVKDC